MNLINKKVEHITFGSGVITEVNDNKIWVQFEDNIGTKIFLYPDAFDRFLKAVNTKVEDNIMMDLHKKQEQMELEQERIREEREAAELEEKKAKLELAKKKTTRQRKKKTQS
jgi:hypothetical protein